MSNAPDWTASTYSAGEGQCVEWAPEYARTTGNFLIRDSKAADGPHLTLSRTAFTGLVTFARTTDV